MSEKDLSPQARELVEIIRDYGAVLKTIDSNIVADVKTLPHPKKKIHDSVLAVLKATDKDTATHKSLKTGFLMLAQFQEGVGEQPISIDPEALIARHGTDPEAIADDEWECRVQAERSRLVDELRANGAWAQ